MSDVSVIKIHEGNGIDLFLLSTGLPCSEIYRVLRDQYNEERTVIDLSNIVDLSQLLEREERAEDVSFCLRVPGCHPGNRDDVQAWMMKNAVPLELLRITGDMYVLVNLSDMAPPSYERDNAHLDTE